MKGCIFNKREESKEKTRALLITVSMDLFSINGYSATTMEMIAKSAGVSKGLTYTYFASKSHLLFEILSEFIEKRRIAIESVMEQELSPLETIRKLIDTFVDLNIHNKENLKQVRIIHSLIVRTGSIDSVEPIAEKLRHPFNELRKRIVHLMEKLGFCSPKNEALYFQTVMTGIITSYLMHGESYPYKIVIKELMNRYEQKVRNEQTSVC